MINHIQSCCLNQPIYLLPLHIPWSIRLVSHLFFFLIYTLVLSANFPFFRNLAILLSSEIVIFMINFRPIRSIIILVKKIGFCYHSYDYRPNRTPLSPITITYVMEYSTCHLYFLDAPTRL